jgi:hypothetical protein
MEKDPKLTAMLSALNTKLELSYANPYRITTFKEGERSHSAFRPPSKVVTPDEVDYLYYSATDIGLKKEGKKIHSFKIIESI